MGKTAGGYPRVLKDGHMMIWPDVTKEMNDYRRGYLTLQAEVERLKGAIHYPGCWDTVAYPTLLDAVSAFACAPEDCTHKERDNGHICENCGGRGWSANCEKCIPY